ncbi:cytochrome P450 [Blastocladiella britannica]|nr:cytochrome P450 [Blastocladiella britannica]
MAKETVTALVAAAISLVAIGLGTFYRRVLVIPTHLLSLPGVSPWTVIRLALRRTPFLDSWAAQMAEIRADALRRGLITSADATPRLWRAWSFGRWTVVVANPDDLKTVLTRHEVFEKFAVTRFTSERSRLAGENVVSATTPTWKIHRKVVNPAFRRGFATELFAEPTRALLGQLDRLADAGKPVEIADWMQRMTLDALSSGVFGRNFDSINHPEGDAVQSYAGAMKLLFDPLSIVFGKLADLHPRRRNAIHEADRFKAFVLTLIEEKSQEMAARRSGRASLPHSDSAASDLGDLPSKEDDAEPHDLLEMMIDAAAEEGRGFSREDLRSNLIVFFIAGHDTTANTLAFALYLLGMHPEVQSKARAEVLAVMGDAKTTGSEKTSPAEVPFPTNDQQHKQLPYLTQVIKETMRIYPSVPVIFGRELQRDVVLHDGLKLPAGSLVSSHILAVQRAREYWGADAGVFRPERWEGLGTTGEPGDSNSGGGVPLHPGAHDFAWAPFGGGQRICLGQQFSVIEQRVLLAMMLVRYEWKVVGDERALAGNPATTPAGLLHVEGVQLQLTRRN